MFRIQTVAVQVYSLTILLSCCFNSKYFTARESLRTISQKTMVNLQLKTTATLCLRKVEAEKEIENNKTITTLLCILKYEILQSKSLPYLTKPYGQPTQNKTIRETW
jgi:hypothetical protein